MIKLNNKKYTALLISSILIVVIATISVTYAYLAFNDVQESTNTLSTSCYNISFKDEDSINITSYPMSSSTAFRTITPYTFTISNNDCQIGSNYQVILNVKNQTSDSLLSYINYSLDGTTTTRLTSLTPTTLPTGVTSTDVKASYIIETGILPNINTSKTYDLYLWIDETAGNDIMNLAFEAEVMIYSTPTSPQEEVLAMDYILSQNTVNEETPDFSAVATTNEGIFMAEDDYGTSYYWRGDVDNNYFYFAGYYWRIIRINGDGTIRMIYQGTSANSTGDDANAFSSEWADNQNSNAYVGYMYGSTSSSTYEGTHTNTNSSVMKNNLDDWYDENLLDYTKFIADSGFCGDRSLSSGTGIGTTTSYYGAYGRLVNSKTPTFKCTNENDLYTTSSNEYGNQALTNPIGLITADEVSMAGGVSSGTSGSSNTSYYLYTGSNYKIFSPYGYFNDNGTVRAVLFGVDTNGVLRRFSNTTSAHGVRPVINLNKDIELEGSGTSSDPYRLLGTTIS